MTRHCIGHYHMDSSNVVLSLASPPIHHITHAMYAHQRRQPKCYGYNAWNTTTLDAVKPGEQCHKSSLSRTHTRSYKLRTGISNLDFGLLGVPIKIIYYLAVSHRIGRCTCATPGGGDIDRRVRTYTPIRHFISVLMSLYRMHDKDTARGSKTSTLRELVKRPM